MLCGSPGFECRRRGGEFVAGRFIKNRKLCFVVVVAMEAVNASLLENKHTTCISTHFQMELHNKVSLLVSSERFTVHKK